MDLFNLYVDVTLFVYTKFGTYLTLICRVNEYVIESMAVRWDNRRRKHIVKTNKKRKIKIEIGRVKTVFVSIIIQMLSQCLLAK